MASPEFTDLLKAVAICRLPGFTESKALLYWFLYNVFRLDETQARDSICDGQLDKGMDAIWVDEDTSEIFFFQSKYSATPNSYLGDNDLKNFVGSLGQFKSRESIEALLNGNAHQDLKNLLKRINLADRVEEGYDLKLVFVTLETRNEDASTYLDSQSDLSLWDQPMLISHHKAGARQTRITESFAFALREPAAEYVLPSGNERVAHVLVRADEIAQMTGIADRSLFALNVRLGLGRTRVNKDLESAIRRKDMHGSFLIFHNGITVICDKWNASLDYIEFENYSVVNGCQSAIAFFENKKFLTENLRIFARVIAVGDNDSLAEEITYRSNNQNGINLRDLRANDRVQLLLKNGFKDTFGGKVDYLIKQGEVSSAGESISNESAGQEILAFYLDEPYSAHQKYRIFGADVDRIFSRGIDVWKIYFAHRCFQTMARLSNEIADGLVAEYQLTKFILLGLLGNSLRQTEMTRSLLDDPRALLESDEEGVMKGIWTYGQLLVKDFDYYLSEQKADLTWDYKNEFKSREKYRSMVSEMIRVYARSTARRPEDAIDRIILQAL